MVDRTPAEEWIRQRDGRPDHLRVVSVSSPVDPLRLVTGVSPTEMLFILLQKLYRGVYFLYGLNTRQMKRAGPLIPEA